MALLVSLLWWVAIVTPLIYIFVKILVGLHGYMERCRILMRLPGVPPRNLLLGHVTEFPGPGENGLKFLIDRTKEHPKLSYIFLGPFPSVQIVHPETAKAVFRTAEPKPVDTGGVYRFLLPWLGKGLLVSGGAQWARNRKLLTPAFHFDILKPYMKVNNAAAEVLLDKCERFHQKGEYMDVFNNISMCTFDIILRCAFSYDSNCQLKGESDPYVRAVSELAIALPYRVLRPWLYPDFLFRLTSAGRQFQKNCNYVHKLADEIIQKRKASLASGKVNLDSRKYLDFLDILLTAKDADGKGLTDSEIRQEVDTFMFEGHDTTASGISWTLFSLAEHSEHMKKCQQELDEVLDEKGEDTIDWEDLPRLKYLSMCIKEALRLHTTVPFVQRITTKDCYIDGYFIPKGTNISLQLYVMLHNPTVWDKHSDFIPERFATHNTDKMDSHQFVPFSAGPRNCIGQHFALHEMKVIIGRMLRRYDLELKPGHEVRHEIMTVMKAEKGIFLRALPRQTHMKG